MKKHILALAAIVIAFHSWSQAQFYGEAFDKSQISTLNNLYKAMDMADSVDMIISAEIIQTCKKAGCWMEIQNAEGTMKTKVFMKDHAFGVPLEGCEKKSCIVHGRAFRYNLSVEYLRHLAEDAGKSKAEIEKITQPETAIAIDAWGVWID
ncbi:MAG: DUF4920 domain-containing protein [Bacteroidetes bacterium]|nr:DUF4920 domain-containing protein [Bacteroidota bacterium]